MSAFDKEKIPQVGLNLLRSNAAGADCANVLRRSASRNYLHPKILSFPTS